MPAKIKTGDSVRWNTSQGETRGKVVRKLTRSTKIKGHTAKPSSKNPEYLVRSKKSGKTAAHKASALKKG
jgi:hypothetical protein